MFRIRSSSHPFVLFCYPPFHDPDMQYLAPPLLATGVSRSLPSIECAVDDLNLRWYKQYLDTIRIDVEPGVQASSAIAKTVQTFRSWVETLANAMDAPGYRISYRKVMVPFDWTKSSTLANEVQRADNPLRKSLEPLILADRRYADAQVVCISLGVEDQIVGAFTVASIIRSHYPDTWIIWGGNIISRLGQSLKDTQLGGLMDRLVIGEGEDQIVSMLADLFGLPVSSVETVTYPTLAREYEQPRVDWSTFGCKGYFAPEVVTPVLASRRCYWAKCDYCAIYATWDKGFRTRSPMAVVDELEQLALVGRRYIRFVDEDLPPSMMVAIANEVRRRGIDIRWEAYSRFEPLLLREAVCEGLYESGCRQLFFGLENVGATTSSMINKGSFYMPLNITGVLRNTALAGILNYTFVLVGIPNTPIDEEQETLGFLAANADVDAVVLGSFVVDRLSPIHLNPEMHAKYGIAVFERGDMATEIGYAMSKAGPMDKELGQERAKRYTEQLFASRPDLALTSLVTEEQRLVLVDRFGRNFAKQYVARVGDGAVQSIVLDGLKRAVAEKIDRKLGAS